MARLHSRSRGSTLVEMAFVTTVFLIMIAGILECGIIGFVSSSVSFASRRAARYASLSGSASGHPAAVADIQAEARASIVDFDPQALTVAVTWTPDNKPGSTVQVQVSYQFRPALLPLSPGVLTLASTSRQVIVQ